MDDATLAAVRVAASAAVDIGVAGLVGAVATLALLGAPASGWAERRAAGARRALVAAAGLALAASVARLAVLALTMADADAGFRAALRELPGIVGDTHAGRAWAAEAGALAAGLALAATGRGAPSRGRAIAIAAALLALAGARASAGHAGASGGLAQGAVMTIHLLATGAWAGTVGIGAIVTARADPVMDADGRAAFARWASGLSRLATAALALVAATGAWSAWLALGGRARALLPASDASAWAMLLDAKLALVALAVALGAVNRFAALPALAREDAGTAAAATAARRFLRVLRVEAGVLLAVFAAAALLANAEPPWPS